jgi:hypothetical protein
MVKMYKLVAPSTTKGSVIGYTQNNTAWEIGKTNTATKKGIEMCTAQVLHCYRSPEEAILFNPIHANIDSPVLLEIECSEIVNSDGLKYATKAQTPVKTVCLPSWSTKKKAAFAIKLAMHFYKAAEFIKWANNWLNGVDRSESAAWSAAAAAAWSAARSAESAESAARSAAWSAESAESAAAAAAWSAARSAAWSAAWSAARSAESAESAAELGNIIQEIIQWVNDCFVE